VVTYEDNLKEHLLIDLHELLVPLLDISSLFARVGVVIGSGWGIVLVMLAPLNDLLENRLVDLGEARCKKFFMAGQKRDRSAYIWDGDGLGHGSLSEILHHVLNTHGALSDVAIYCSESVYAIFAWWWRLPYRQRPQHHRC
jgi:hypothetical protein